MRVLIDTNIVLDFLLQREPFSQDAELLFQAIDVGEVVGYVTATTLTDIFYISRRHTRSIEQARQAVSETLTVMMICPVDRPVMELLGHEMVFPTFVFRIRQYYFAQVGEEEIPLERHYWLMLNQSVFSS